MNASEVLRKALELLGPNGENWCQHGYHFGDSHCMQGAVHLVTSDQRTRNKCWSAMVKVLPPFESGNPIARWNDDSAREWPDVEAAFRKAITLAEQEEAAHV
jgi:hypothetical protein